MTNILLECKLHWDPEAESLQIWTKDERFPLMEIPDVPLTAERIRSGACLVVNDVVLSSFLLERLTPTDDNI